MSFPREFTRVTKHAKPRYQVYQPGFNAQNSCWLDGEWVTLPKPEWDTRRGEYEALAATVRAESKLQNWRDPATPLDRLTAAQRRAWEYLSGAGSFEVIFKTGRVEPVRLNLAGNKFYYKDLEWLRGQGVRLIRKVKRGAEVVDQLADIVDIPEDLVYADTAVDAIALHRKQLKEHNYNVFLQYVERAKRADGVTRRMGMSTDASLGWIALRMAIQSLIMKEASIIKAEWEESKQPETASWNDSSKELLEEYVQMRKDASVLPQVEEALGSMRREHNDCARENLDSSDGVLYNFVLPEFNADGTHPPFGERDVPWAR